MNNIPRVIGICGYPGSGKDTIADVLVAEFGFWKYRMADPLKKVIADIYSLDLEKLSTDQEYKSTTHPNLDGKTPRFAFQHLGTEGFREITENTWVYYAERVINERKEFIVIPDIRFPNEASLVNKLGGIIIRTRRDGTDKKYKRNWLQRLFGLSVHKSERYVEQLTKQAHHVFHNDSSLESFKEQIRHYFKGYFNVPTSPL